MRCKWCGNPNPLSATTCAVCGKDLVSEQSTLEAVSMLESIDVPEASVICPGCGAENFLSTEFCSLCKRPLHPGARWPERRRLRVPIRPGGLIGLPPAGAALLAASLVAVLFVFGALLAASADWDSLVAGSSTATRSMQRIDISAAAQVAPDPELFEDDVADRKRTVPKEKVSAEDRAAAAARKAWAREQAAARAAWGKPNGRFVLDVPNGARKVREERDVSSGTARGSRVLSVEKPVAEVIAYFADHGFMFDAERQGLTISGYYVARSDGKDKPPTAARFPYSVNGRDGLSVTIDIARTGTGTEIEVRYVLPSGWALDFD